MHPSRPSRGPLRCIVIEPDARLRGLVRARLSALGDALDVVGGLEEGQARLGIKRPALVIARGRGDASLANALACAFDLQEGPASLRLLVLTLAHEGACATRDPGAYLHDLDVVMAGTRMPEAAAARGEPAAITADFPRDVYESISHVGGMEAAEIFWTRQRVTGRKELVVQVADSDPAAPCVTEALYADFAARGSAAGVLRHEVTRHHSFIASASLPLDLARRVDDLRRASARRLPRAA